MILCTQHELQVGDRRVGLTEFQRGYRKEHPAQPFIVLRPATIEEFRAAYDAVPPPRFGRVWFYDVSVD